MFDRIKRLYDNGELSKDGIKNAVKKGLITESEYSKIVGEEYK